MSRGVKLPAPLRHRLTLETPDHQPDGLGGQTPVWTPALVLWGEVDAPGSLRSLEPGEAGQGMPRAEVRIRVRRRAGLAAGQRLRWGNRLFLLRAVRDDGTSPYLELITEERHDDGL